MSLNLNTAKIIKCAFGFKDGYEGKPANQWEAEAYKKGYELGRSYFDRTRFSGPHCLCGCDCTNCSLNRLCNSL